MRFTRLALCALALGLTLGACAKTEDEAAVPADTSAMAAPGTLRGAGGSRPG
jgi:hypothetical protein